MNKFINICKNILKLKVFRIIVFFVFIFLIYLEFKKQHQLSSFEFIYLLTNLNLRYVFIAFILMILNWSIESYKWKQLCKSIQKINMKTAIRATLSGLSISFIAPNRIGMFVGRILFLQKQNRLTGTVYSFFGSIIQFFVTVFIGLVFIFLLQNGGEFNINALIIFLLFILILIFIIFQYKFLIIKLCSLNKMVFKNLKRVLVVYKKFDNKLLFQIMLLSTIRYFVFSFQFLLLLQAFNINFKYDLVLYSIGKLYLLTTIIPSLTFAEIGLREYLALEIIGKYITELWIILLATFLLWVINLLVPSIVGSFFMFKKISKK